MKLIVVEAFNPCPCHTMVTARHIDQPSYVYTLVRSPLDINTGDTLLSPGVSGHPDQNSELYLYRGPDLIYHIITDNVPQLLIQRLIAERFGASSDNDDNHNPAEVGD